MNIQEIRAQIVQQLIQSYGDRYSPSVILDEAEKLVKYIQNGPDKGETAKVGKIPPIDQPKKADPRQEALKEIQEKVAKIPPQTVTYTYPWATRSHLWRTPYYTLGEQSLGEPQITTHPQQGVQLGGSQILIQN